MNERVIEIYDIDGKRRRISVDFIEQYIEYKQSMKTHGNKGFLNKIKDHSKRKLEKLNMLLESNSKDLFNRNVFQ